MKKYVIRCNKWLLHFGGDFLLFQDDKDATYFSTVLDAVKAIEKSIEFANKHGYEKQWGYCFLGHSIEPVEVAA